MSRTNEELAQTSAELLDAAMHPVAWGYKGSIRRVILSALTAATAELRQEIVEQANGYAATIADLTKQVAELRADIETHQAIIAIRDKEIEHLKTAKDVLDAEVGRLKAVIQFDAATIASLRKEKAGE